MVSSVPTGLFIDGAWRAAADGQQFSVHDPATGDVVARLANATPSDAMDALDAADRAFPAWSCTPQRQRAELLRRTLARRGVVEGKSVSGRGDRGGRRTI